MVEEVVEVEETDEECYEEIFEDEDNNGGDETVLLGEQKADQ